MHYKQATGDVAGEEKLSSINFTSPHWKHVKSQLHALAAVFSKK
jgi:hypothetical protein